MYQVLYRKWRSPTFSDVVGQNHVTQTLRRALLAGRLSHAYLFTGPRGTGKTSCARILAKAVNCPHPSEGEPCNACDICKGIDSGSLLDVIEIDAASNNGVDNIRDLRDETNFLPSQGKYRVYIVDEVHMLSAGAFNALLKTLEEPPGYVIFILATTEAHKLPATVLSRCQRFDFHRISAEDIAARLLHVAEGEHLALEPAAALLLARVADGALRDALSLLDRCRVEGEPISAAYVARCIGIADRRYLFALIDAVLERDIATCLSLVQTLYQDACDMERLCEELLSHLRNLLILLTVRNPKEFLLCTDEDLQLYQAQAGLLTTPQLLRFTETLEQAAISLRRSTDRRLEMELALIKLSSPAPHESAPPAPQPSPTIPAPQPSPAPHESEPPAPQPSPTPHESEPPAASGEDRLFAEWPSVVVALQSTNPPLAGILNGSTAYVRGDFVLIKSDNAAFGAFIKQNTHANSLREAIYHVTDRKVRLGLYRSSAEQQPVVGQDPLARLAENYSRFN
ncbi:MAG: DNA polymerase III subunit gamma/tau [Oscillospiraceae bacterium]|nr:DNA polymerase III subunit gamma/tau [Oscillospiraceae bacterium]